MNTAVQLAFSSELNFLIHAFSSNFYIFILKIFFSSGIIRV